ncbi:FtsX-like permease family protein [Sphingomicrobium astaxanthinifaciens]|uniref:FtsX-like permease family protein n=1 Tax=Sphingomicrobium astaxanthinifaciens TaxID=1227949 RepID=UPI001FCBD34F|nr:permease [Sphingomicrobium astaxanthinifaciens]MCJ7421155.1 permease [Sphingomicrobium astaxanthinifaciens]
MSARAPRETSLLPGLRGKGAGATGYLLAIMLFVMTVTGAAGLALANGSRLVAAASAGDYVVQLPGGADEADALARFVAAQPGVTEATAVPRAEVDALLARWLGPAAREADLPLPALVEVRVEGRATALEAALADRYPGAGLAAQAETLAPLLGALRAVALAGLGLVLAIALAAAAAVVLATRAALAANRATIATLHGMGATDGQVARQFDRRIARDALSGGTLGSLLAILLLFAVSRSGGASLSFLVGGARLIDAGDLALLFLLPPLAASIAYVVARATILRDLHRQP